LSCFATTVSAGSSYVVECRGKGTLQCWSILPQCWWVATWCTPTVIHNSHKRRTAVDGYPYYISDL